MACHQHFVTLFLFSTAIASAGCGGEMTGSAPDASSDDAAVGIETGGPAFPGIDAAGPPFTGIMHVSLGDSSAAPTACQLLSVPMIATVL